MDIFTHAVTGAVTGLAFGYPMTGAVAGIAPDLVLGIKRRVLPTLAYSATHSFFGALLCSTAVWLAWGPRVALVGLLAFLSHLWLDYLTHGPDWAPTLLFPWMKRFGAGHGEWEWFDDVWWYGFSMAMCWISFFVFVSIFK